jgi:hypothetical protein
MAQRFVEQATQQLSPLYQQQEQSLRSQMPSIQNLYDTLLGGLEQQRGVENQRILESAGQRGVLRSSMPVDLQQDLGRAILQQRGGLEMQRAQDIGGLNQRIGDLGLNRANAIQSLAMSLQEADQRQRQFEAAQEAERQRIAREQAASAQQNAAFQELIRKLTENATQPMPQFNPIGDRPDLGSIFGANSTLRVGGTTQQNLLQPAGRVIVQPAANARPFQPAAPTRLTQQPKLQGGGAISGTLRVR